MACRSVGRIQRTPLLRGARAASSAVIARSDHSQQRLALLQRQPQQVTVLSNGVQVVTQRRTDVPTASVGLFRKGGSEQETRSTNGISGVFQRVQQRGTKSLTGPKLAAKVGSLQGRVHSVNERQHNGTVFSSPKEHVAEGISLLADMAINPALNKADVDVEKERSLRVLDAAQYDMERVITDYMHDIAFQGTTLALSPLGNTEGLKSISPESLHLFGQQATVGENLLLAVVGDVDHEQVLAAAEKSFSGVRAGPSFEFNPVRYTGSELEVVDDNMAHLHTGIAFEAPAYGNSDSLAMEAGRHIAGSYDRSFGVDARHGLVRPAFDAHNYEYNVHQYSVKTMGHYYATSGLWGVYFVTTNGSQETSFSYISKEWHRIRARCRDSDVARAKCDMKAELAAVTETPTGHVELMGKQHSAVGRIVPLHEMDQRIENLNASHVRQVFDEYFYDTDPVQVAVGHADTELDYFVTRKLMWMSEMPDH